MQFTTLSALTTLALATFAVAVPTSGSPSSQCNTGSVQCCNSLQDSSEFAAAGLLALLGVVVQDVTAQVGLTCTPVTAVGLGGNSCTQQAACCENNNFNGVIALGCNPINL
ncbi:hypothetical protein HYPSUDRAFT_197683 [Hypholoma sublateritium FD-334 SS-4]|uniref:Hydrophobin n=1 Tax=Hypholoma sublateritium (strain FD-334 SS-4) TaxID=945553 RepID=A0A0D2PI74_HYPSF|nr:hypothetical protein HYPSUDRAFT_197683 [Hypholoma sublateritium FD-334 SS-4]